MVTRASIRGSIDEVEGMPASEYCGNQDSGTLSCRNWGVRKTLTPVRGLVLVNHGPRGCGFRSRIGLRDPSLGGLYFHTDLSEPEVISGGREKLQQAVATIDEEFNPEFIVIMNTCPTALNGDDIISVARYMETRVKAKVAAIDAAGVDGRDLVFGIEAACNVLIDRLMVPQEIIPRSINVWGMTNMNAVWDETGSIFAEIERMGVRILNVFTNNSSCKSIEKAPAAELNVCVCPMTTYRSLVHMQEKFGTPFLVIDPPIGIEQTREGLLQIAEALKLPKSATDKVEEETEYYRAELAKLRPYLEGKTAAIFGGGSKVPSFLRMAAEAGMEPKVLGMMLMTEYLVPEAAEKCGTVMGKIRCVAQKYGLSPQIMLNVSDLETKEVLATGNFDLYSNCISRMKLAWQTKTHFHNSMDMEDLGRAFAGTLRLYREWARTFKGAFDSKYGEFVKDDLMLITPEGGR